MNKVAFLLIVFLGAGCTSYKIPIQTDNHPASSDVEITQIELSSILDINENNHD